MTQDAGRDSAAPLGSGPVDAGDFALARALAEYLHESSALRHGLFTPVQFKDIVFARIMDFLKRQRACDSELLRTVSRPGAVLTVRAVTIPAKIQASITTAISPTSCGRVGIPRECTEQRQGPRSQDCLLQS